MVNEPSLFEPLKFYFIELAASYLDVVPCDNKFKAQEGITIMYVPLGVPVLPEGVLVAQ